MLFNKISSCLLFLCLVLNAVPVLAERSDHSKLMSLDVTDYMVSGQKYSVNIKYKNVGATVWDAKKGYRIIWAEAGLRKIWGAIDTARPFDPPVAPGESVVIGFDLTAPASIRIAQLSWQLQGPDGKSFGEVAMAKSVRIEHSDKQARIVMQLVPAEVAVGQSFNADFRVENIGATAWSRAMGFQLAALKSGVWGLDNIELDSDAHVAPGEIARFSASFTAPEHAGVYPFQWQMRQNNTFFGDVSAPVDVVIIGNANASYSSEFVYQKIAQTMLLGETHEVVVQFKNSSKLAWHAGDISLVTLIEDSLAWAVDSVAVSSADTIAPGEYAIFRFNVQAPLDAGQYPFQWQMSHRRHGLFGRPSERLIIDVK